jgi:methionine-rich copper-binding protein CopC
MSKHLSARICALAVVFLASAAWGHAVLVDSTPMDGGTVQKAPEKIVLTFDARIEKKVFTASLKDADGKKVDLPQAKQEDDPPEQIVLPMPKLSPGTYQLEFQVLASDGHSTPGLLHFTVAAEKKQ